MVTKDAAGIKGLYYIENYLSTKELDKIKEKLADIEWTPIFKGDHYRRVKQYGYSYSYNRSGLTIAPKIPEFLSELVDTKRINEHLKEDLLGKEFEQVIINEFKPNQMIDYHIDNIKQFGPIVASITIGQAVPVKFKKDDEIISVDIAEESMYLMTGDARYEWQHSLRNNTLNDRYSLTFRTII